MKTKLTITMLLGLLTIAFIFNNKAEKPASPPQPTINDNEFMIGVMDCAFDNLYANIHDLNLNAWHKYTDAAPSTCNSAHGWFAMNYGFLDWIANDRYYNATTGYGSDISSRITANRNEGMRTIMDRPKIQYLAFGQRSFYQCEQKEHLSTEFGDYNFYTYNGSIHNPLLYITDGPDNSSYGHGEMVKQCIVNDEDPGSNAGFIVSELNTNHEQSSKGWTNPSTTESSMNFKQRDDLGKWYVLPRIRIEPGVVINYPETPVCSLEIRDWNGELVKQQIILAKNFKNDFTTYDGQYISEFYWNPSLNEPPAPIEISEGQLSTEPDHIFTYWTCGPNDTGKIYVDYRIYWYGQCNAWFDYVCVENEPAYELFDEPVNIHNWPLQIQAETDLALHGSTNSGYVPNQFYIEEFEFNNIPCIGKVNQIIQDYALQKGVELSLMISVPAESLCRRTLRITIPCNELLDNPHNLSIHKIPHQSIYTSCSLQPVSIFPL